MKAIMEKGKRFIPLCLLSLLLTSGCSQSVLPASSSPKPSPTPSPTAPLSGTLKIAYFDNQQFTRTYGNSFRKKYPDVTLQVVNMVKNQGGKTVFLDNDSIMQQKPDVVFGTNLIQPLADTGQLVDLTSRIKPDKIDLNELVPGALNNLKELGGGKLVALSAGFQTMALYYNKDLFEHLQLAYPTDNMSWPNVLELAKKIARTENGKNLYGLTYMTNNAPPYLLADKYMDGVLANPVRPELTRKADYTSAPYMSAVYTVMDAFTSGAFFHTPEKQAPPSSTEEAMSRDPFLSGNAGMTLNSPSYMESMAIAPSHGAPKFQWDLVAEPVNPANPNLSFSVTVPDVFAISKDSPNQELAWAYLKFLIGPEMAADLPQTYPYALSIRNDAVKTRYGHKLDAFYAHQPMPIRKPVISQEAYTQIRTITGDMMNSIIYGHTAVPDGLHEMQNQVQHVLDQDQPSSAKK